MSAASRRGAALAADVVVPVYRDVLLTRACIESVLEHSGPALRRLIIVDDRGPEPDMAPMLERFATADCRVVLLRNEENRGFVGSTNRGMSVRQGDVVLLNNDTRVTSGWLGELLDVAHSEDRIAAVVPLSNNATLCSVPDYGRAVAPEVLEGKDLALSGLPRFTEVPTGVGFCLLLKHRALNELGLFDPAYGRGYNEENDWCQRAQAKGYVIARANWALVFHLGQVSFGDQKNALDRKNARLLVHRYPHYLRQNQAFDASPDARVAASLVRARTARVRVQLQGGSAQLAAALKRQPELEVVERAAHEALSDVELVHRASPVETPAELAALLASHGQLVFEFDDVLLFRSPGARGSFDETSRARSVTHAALRSAQAVVTSSSSRRDELVSELHLARELVHVVPLELTGPVGGSDLTLPPRYFLAPVSDAPWDNLSLLLAGYALYRAQVSAPAALVLCGSRHRFPPGLYSVARRFPAGVHVLPELDEQRAGALSQRCVAVVLPSSYAATARPALNALASGARLICTNLSVFTELGSDAALWLTERSPEELADALLSDAGALRPPGAEDLSQKHGALARARALAKLYVSVLERPAPQALFERRHYSELLGALR